MTDQQQEHPRKRDAPSRGKGRLPSGFATIRDVVAFAAGLCIIGNEVFISKTAEPAVIAVGVAMLGLPAVFGADERRKGNESGGDGEPPRKQPEPEGEP